MSLPIKFDMMIKSAEDLNLFKGPELGVYANVFILHPNNNNNNNNLNFKTQIVKHGHVGTKYEWNYTLGFTIDDLDSLQGHLTLVVQLKANGKEGVDYFIGEVRVNIKELLEMNSDDDGNGEKHLSYVIRTLSGEAKGLLNFSCKFEELMMQPPLPLSHAAAAQPSSAATFTAAYSPSGGSQPPYLPYGPYAYPPPPPYLPFGPYAYPPPPPPPPPQPSILCKLATQVGLGILVQLIASAATGGF
ncbi:protein SRC2 homolog [Fagus crenata]